MNDQPIATDIRFFSLERIGRLRYLAYALGLFLLAMGLLGFCYVVGLVSAGLGIALGLCVYLGMFVVSVTLMIRRLHDQDLSGWWCLLGFIPLVNLILIIMLLFIPGTIGENRFGLQPPPNTGWVIVGAIAYIAFIPVGILAAIAIPAYQDYIARSQMSEGIQLAGGAEVALAEYHRNHNGWPDELQAVYATAGHSPAGRYVESVTGIAAGNSYGVVSTMKVEGVNRVIEGRSVELWTEDGGDSWHCGPGGSDPVDPKFLPMSCRERGAP